MDRAELETLHRESLVARAEAKGIRRARILTRPELIDELLRLEGSESPTELRRARGFFGLARDLLARVVERGLHLPDAAERIRAVGGEVPSFAPRVDPQAIPTVTLAEIYAAQGHRERAIETLKRVLEREPEHVPAQNLLARLEDDAYEGPTPRLPPEPEATEAPPGPPDASPPSAPSSARDAAAEAPTEAAAEAASSAGPETEPRGQLRAEAQPEPAPECLALAIGRTGYVWWTISAETLARAAVAEPSARFVVRLVIVAPSWDGPTTTQRDVEAAPTSLEITIADLPEPCVLRAAIGFRDGDVFQPVAHSPALEVSTHGELARWTLSGFVPVVLDEPRASVVARAVRERSQLPVS